MVFWEDSFKWSKWSEYKNFSSSKYDLNTWLSYIKHVATNVLQLLKQDQFIFILYVILMSQVIKGSRMGHSVKVSLWCVTLLINTRFRFFILE